MIMERMVMILMDLMRIKYSNTKNEVTCNIETAVDDDKVNYSNVSYKPNEDKVKYSNEPNDDKGIRYFDGHKENIVMNHIILKRKA